MHKPVHPRRGSDYFCEASCRPPAACSTSPSGFQSATRHTHGFGISIKLPASTICGRAVHVLTALKASRSPRFRNTAGDIRVRLGDQHGTLSAKHAVITSTPYLYEAFDAVSGLDPREEWPRPPVIARHLLATSKDFKSSDSCQFMRIPPDDTRGRVVNAALPARSCSPARAAVSGMITRGFAETQPDVRAREP